MRHHKHLSMVAMTMMLVAATATVTSAAPKPKLSKTKVTLTAGKTATLTLKNSKKKVKWSSSKKAVVTVKALGKNKVKLTAKKKGSAVVTAKIGKKKYSCKVTVKAASKAKSTNKKSSKKSTKQTANPYIDKYGLGKDQTVKNALKFSYSADDTIFLAPGETLDIKMTPDKYLQFVSVNEYLPKTDWQTNAITSTVINDTTVRITARHEAVTTLAFHAKVLGAKNNFRSFKVGPTLYVVSPEHRQNGFQWKAFMGSILPDVNFSTFACPFGGDHNLMYIHDSKAAVPSKVMNTHVFCTKCQRGQKKSQVDAAGIHYTDIPLDFSIKDESGELLAAVVASTNEAINALWRS